ncbi:MAG: DegT/DnrJ/EryC1/StrS family aminotransferase [Deltaproteobacteria bacterium]|nr:DegT/DnrJ/EryC1/StrS family aminotransferase [Deltaproteobacteria bacterium]
MRKDFLVFGSPAIEEAEIEEVVDSLRSGWLGTGPKVARFENDFASYKGMEESHIAAVNSCTAALHLSMIAAGIGPGDEVITTALTFCATVNAIIHAGAIPVLADINPQTMNIDPAEIMSKITSKTRAILPVHFAGRCCDMDSIMEIANRHDLKVIEDCAHAMETEYHGKKCGTFGEFGCFSFYVTKNVVTGEGGIIMARRIEDIDRIKTLALHGMNKDAWHRFGDDGYKHYYVVEAGFKYNMTDLQAAIGIHQLKRVEKNWLRRQEIWGRYQRVFKDLPVTCPSEPDPDTRHGYHLYTILIDEDRTGMSRDEFLDKMTSQNIGVGVHYLSVPEHPFYQQTLGFRPEDFPHAMGVGRQTVSLPFSTKLADEDVGDVIGAVEEVLKQLPVRSNS